MTMVFVHRYKWSHYQKWRQMKRKAARGEAKIIKVSRDGILYKLTPKPTKSEDNDVS